jgi:hypothetical protein
MKAIDAVKNLRVLADLLEKHGEAEICMSSATIWFNEKEPFLKVAKDFPRPIKKVYDEGKYGDLYLNHGELSKAGLIQLTIRRSYVCELIEPARAAVFKCDSILSPDEETSLEEA